jgi:hypothetical protein
VEKRGALAEGNLRSGVIELGCELSNLCGHAPQQGRRLFSAGQTPACIVGEPGGGRCDGGHNSRIPTVFLGQSAVSTCRG